VPPPPEYAQLENALGAQPLDEPGVSIDIRALLEQQKIGAFHVGPRLVSEPQIAGGQDLKCHVTHDASLVALPDNPAGWGPAMSPPARSEAAHPLQGTPRVWPLYRIRPAHGRTLFEAVTARPGGG
jgi:hypothetical protein